MSSRYHQITKMFNLCVFFACQASLHPQDPSCYGENGFQKAFGAFLSSEDKIAKGSNTKIERSSCFSILHHFFCVGKQRYVLPSSVMGLVLFCQWRRPAWILTLRLPLSGTLPTHAEVTAQPHFTARSECQWEVGITAGRNFICC